MSRLTIVLPLKDRHEFTYRFLRQRLPYTVLIADGSYTSFYFNNFSNAQCAVFYRRYPPDKTLSDYWAKLADAVSKVDTPYVMMADNDDFVIPSGCERAMNFLDTNNDYVCAGGGLGGFSTYGNNPTGNINRWSFRYTHLDVSTDINGHTAIERLANGSRQWWSYYAVYRTEILQKITQEVKEIDFSDMQLHEFYCAMRTMTLGKAYNDPTCFSYFRQYGTSMEGFKHDWVHHILRSNFNEDLRKMKDRIGHDVVLEILDEWLDEFLHTYYGSMQGLKHKLRQWPRLYNWLKNRRRYSVWLEKQAILYRVPSVKAELETIEALCAKP